MNELRTVLPYFRPYRAGVVAGLALVVVTNLFTVAGPYLIKLSIDGLGDPDVTMGRISTYALFISFSTVSAAASSATCGTTSFHTSFSWTRASTAERGPVISWPVPPTTPRPCAWQQGPPSCTL